jgi:hypothetical protein
MKRMRRDAVKRVEQQQNQGSYLALGGGGRKTQSQRYIVRRERARSIREGFPGQMLNSKPAYTPRLRGATIKTKIRAGRQISYEVQSCLS